MRRPRMRHCLLKRMRAAFFPAAGLRRRQYRPTDRCPQTVLPEGGKEAGPALSGPTQHLFFNRVKLLYEIELDFPQEFSRWRSSNDRTRRRGDPITIRKHRLRRGRKSEATPTDSLLDRRRQQGAKGRGSPAVTHNPILSGRVTSDRVLAFHITY